MTDRELMQMALDALEQCVSTCLDQYSHEQVMSRPEHFMNQAMGALRTALAQPEQEPVAWDPKIERLYDKNGFLLHQKIKRTPSSEWEDYYPEPQREWQGLTDEEMLESENGCSYMDAFDLTLYANNIEAKLKEKNS